MVSTPQMIGQSTVPTELPPAQQAPTEPVEPSPPEEFGGRGGLDPTRYGDWEKNGRCIDF
ncbi:DUF1674 domain-containing protein [Arenimonas oryziterrae]|uniref:DUF1674 domain-containing protein n=2 Tax=Arenimonas oryziterrae TaxID=498055 RepID=UPI0003B3DF98